MTSDIYTVRPGDTLSAIATRNGTTATDLARINGLTNPNKLSIGEKLHLKAETALAVKPLFLDSARNPIEGLNYRLQCGPKTVIGATQPNGLGQSIVTQHPTDQVSIWAKIPWKNNAWEQIAQTISGVGEKLVTLISPAVRVKAPLQQHPLDNFGQPKQEKAPQKSATQHPVGTPSVGKGKIQSEIAKGSGKGIHSRVETGKNGVHRVVLSQDLPDLHKYFSLYKDEAISETDYSQEADKLGCEVAVIKAFGKVESAGGGFDHLKRPKILYERHKFSHHTDHKYDAKNADISSPIPYTNKHFDKQGHRIPPSDQYNGGQRGDDVSWARFAKAWQLGEPQTENAAIEACSWGMFQVLGENYPALGITSAKQFMEYACTSERLQFSKLFIPFVQTKRDKHGSLKDAMIAKDWVRMAILYNGKGYKKYHYDTQLKSAYESFTRHS